MGKNKGPPRHGGAYKHHAGQGAKPPEAQPKPKQVYKKTHPFPATLPSTSSSSSASSAPALSSLQQAFRAKLAGSRFRVINEQLYTLPGAESFSTFQADPTLFEVYHQGFREQAQHWPANPLDDIIAWLRRQASKGAGGGGGGKLVVADMGCGDARLQAELSSISSSSSSSSGSSSSSSGRSSSGGSGGGQCRIEVHSFDLVAPTPNPRGIVACDVAHTPLADGSVDVCVFCLALMGTNIMDFVREAHRVLRVGGVIKIAEVRSRFEDGEGIKRFIRALKKMGFDIAGDHDGRGGGGGGEGRGGRGGGGGGGGGGGRGGAGGGGGGGGRNDMFFEMEGRKSSRQPEHVDFSAKPCIYKRR